MDPAQIFHSQNNPEFEEPVMNSELTWKKFHPLTDQNAFICLVDHMGDDSSIVQAARVSYGKDEQEEDIRERVLLEEFNRRKDFTNKQGTSVTGDLTRHDSIITIWEDGNTIYEGPIPYFLKINEAAYKQQAKDRQLIRYLMNHSHTTPFEMVEIKFMVQVPMDCWRQWIRHRTASVNEYSTRYTEALDFFQVTSPSEWRLQATDNKQGSSGFLEDKDLIKRLDEQEKKFHIDARQLYENRLFAGIAKEQARKDLPLSTYTRAYWKCDLHNIFNFLRLRMDSHAQLEIRQFANCMFEIVKQICPVACEAFEDYVLHAKKFSRMEMEELRQMLKPKLEAPNFMDSLKPSSMTDREWKEFLEKLSK